MPKLIEEKLLDLLKARRREQDLRNKAEDANRWSAAGRSRPRTKGIVGGFVRSYKFMYEEGARIAHGSISAQFGVDSYKDLDATMVIIEPAEAKNGAYCERIVEETEKLANHHESVVEAYFSVYSPQIQKYIVAYERFDGYFDENTKGFDNNPFFANENKSELTDFWRNKMRSLVEVLCTARDRNVIHGGFSNRTSYVVSAGTLKIINVARYGGISHERDLVDLNNYILNDGFCMASTSDDWEGFTYLLNSGRMEKDDWSDALLMHPVLLDAPGKLKSYEEVEVYMWQNHTGKSREIFANAMFLKKPDMYWEKSETGRFVKHVLDFLDLTLEHHKELRKASFSGILYLDIIQIVRNFINHAEDNSKDEWTAEDIVKEISKLFPGFMSMAYSIANVTNADWDKLFNGATLRVPY